MADVLMVLVMAGFIAVCVWYVHWCDRMLGPDPVPSAPAQSGVSDTPDHVDDAAGRETASVAGGR